MRTKEVVYEDGDKTVHTFNEAGKCVRTVDFEEDGSVRFDIQYDVDQQQRTVGWKVFDGKGISSNVSKLTSTLGTSKLKNANMTATANSKDNSDTSTTTMDVVSKNSTSTVKVRYAAGRSSRS